MKPFKLLKNTEKEAGSKDSADPVWHGSLSPGLSSSFLQLARFALFKFCCLLLSRASKERGPRLLRFELVVSGRSNPAQQGAVFKLL